MAVTLVGPSGRITLGVAKVALGRAPDNTLVLDDPRASAHHAVIQPEGAYFRVVDLGSTNGTFVNEQQVFSNTPHLLQPGDAIRIGDTKFTFEATNASQETSYSAGSTVRATPPPAVAPVVAPNFAGSTSYDMGNPGYVTPPGYQYTLPAAQPSYTPPPSSYVSETPLPTYMQAAHGQQSSYSPNQQSAYAPLPPIYAPPPPQKRLSVRTMVLAIIALVVFLGGIGGFFIIQHNQAIHPVASPKAPASTTSTSPGSPYSPFTNLVLNDALQSNGSAQWDTASATHGACQFTSSGYQASLAQQGYFGPCFANNTNYTDFAYQVQMVIQKGDCGGMVFRENGTGASQVFYWFEICQDGTYNLSAFQNGSNTGLLPNGSAASSSSIKKGLNTIAVVVQGSSISLYVNNTNTPIATVTDPNNVSSQGAIGVLADAPNSPTTVTFTNAVVWTQPS